MKKLRLFIAIVCVAFVPGLTELTGQNRSSEVVRAPDAKKSMITPASYYALIIGNNNYQSVSHLNTAESDAKEIDEVLRTQYGFRTKLLLNATRQQIISALNSYRRELDQSANLLVYYAGHGSRDEEARRSYWWPVDATSDDPSNWIAADDITASLKAIPARHVLVISDSCYSGTIARRSGDSTVGAPLERQQYLDKMMAGKSRYLLASGGNEPVADDGGGNHSVFANALLRGLRQMEPRQFTSGELYQRFILQNVAGGSKQTPEYEFLQDSGHEMGEFVFARVTTDLVAPGRTTRETKSPAGPTPDVASNAPDPGRSNPEDNVAAARARGELRDRGIGIDVTGVKNALMSVDVDVLKLLATAKVQPTVIEEAFRQKVGADGATVARRFFENSAKSPAAIKWLDAALASGVDPNFTVPNDYYEREGVLAEAVRAANVPAIKVLLEHGASPHAYQNLFLTTYSLTRFLFPLRFIAEDDRLSLEEKQDLTKSFIKAGVIVPVVINPGQSGWPSVMYEAKNLRDEDGARLGVKLPASHPFCEQPENAICKHAGDNWCATIAKMPNKLKFDFTKASSSPVFDVTLLHLLNIEGNKAYFLGLTRYITYEYVLVEVSKDASSWTVLRYMPPEAGMGLCKKDSDGHQSEYCWRRIPIRRVAGTDEMRFEDWGLSWRSSREDCAALYPKDAVKK